MRTPGGQTGSAQRAALTSYLSHPDSIGLLGPGPVPRLCSSPHPWIILLERKSLPILSTPSLPFTHTHCTLPEPRSSALPSHAPFPDAFPCALLLGALTLQSSEDALGCWKFHPDTMRDRSAWGFMPLGCPQGHDWCRYIKASPLAMTRSKKGDLLSVPEPKGSGGGCALTSNHILVCLPLCSCLSYSLLVSPGNIFLINHMQTLPSSLSGVLGSWLLWQGMCSPAPT